MTGLDLRIATLNISGGEKTFEEFPHNTQKSRQKALKMLVGRLDASVLCLQEASQYVDVDGATHTVMDDINAAGDYEHSFYGKTLSMESHLQVKKDIMVKGIFNDWWNWSKGNAIHSRIPFARLSKSDRTGVPRNIPLYQPGLYEGNRNTDPRYVILTRLKEPPFPFVATLHLTTLVGERQPNAEPSLIEQSQSLRDQQIRRFLDLVRVHILQRNEPLILAGDFNAAEQEPCITRLLKPEQGFVRIMPENDEPSHPKAAEPIDHIFFYPRERLVDFDCWIEAGDLSRRASDHLPVVADLRIK